MKTIIRAVLLCSVLLVVTLTALPQRRGVPPVRIEGAYDNLHVGPPESGDLEGMRIILIDGGGGIYAIVQEAEGGVELPAPALTKVTVKGTDINFTVKFPGHDETQTFSGKVSAAGLRLRRGNPTKPSALSAVAGDELFFLKRRKY
ncbi:MAG TPA: hypothetical protein VGN90_15335 [Pyrinomonadaceae bacterium]|nr:hypothetical protein [Pyrinomonadaceae bacterium]